MRAQTSSILVRRSLLNGSLLNGSLLNGSLLNGSLLSRRRWVPASAGSVRRVLAGLLLSPLVLGVSLLPGEGRAESASTAVSTAERQGGPVGVGLMVGNLSGISFKLALDPAQGIQLRLGSADLNSVALSGSYEYHFRPVSVPDGSYSLPFYVGVGARMQAEAGSTVGFEGGLEGVFGMSILVKDLPVEIFMEVRPRVVLYTPPVTSSDDVWLGAGVEGGMGVHYYF